MGTNDPKGRAGDDEDFSLADLLDLMPMTPSEKRIAAASFVRGAEPSLWKRARKKD
jgi:hypothetical protein